MQSLFHTYRRYRSLQTHRIRALPLVILMPHSACNCRCVMCDIWKDNKNLKQLSEKDIEGLLGTLQKLGTQQVLMSGGEALLNPHFFRFCELLQNKGIRVSLLSTGLTLKKHAAPLLQYVADIIVSLDGDPETHNAIRNIPGAFEQLADSIFFLKSLRPSYRITGRTVIHRLNFRKWPQIIKTAKLIGLDQISFLPADVSSHAFNRVETWPASKQQEILPGIEELVELEQVLEGLKPHFRTEFDTGFIAESPEKLQNIIHHYAAFYGRNPFPFKKCNAPWVSAVVEADGTVRPCFFHAAMGNIREEGLESILNSERNIQFRKTLDTDRDETCKKCVCYLHLSPRTKL